MWTLHDFALSIPLGFALFKLSRLEPKATYWGFVGHKEIDYLLYMGITWIVFLDSLL